MTGGYSVLGHKLRGSRFGMISNRSLPTPIYLIKSVLWSKVVGSKNTENIASSAGPPQIYHPQKKSWAKTNPHKIHPMKNILNHVIKHEPD